MSITAENIDTICDTLGYPIDTAIKPLVIELNRLGVETTASCGGHKDHGLNYPWVDCKFVHLHRYTELIEQFVPEGLRIEFLRGVERIGHYKMFCFRILPEDESIDGGRETFNRLVEHLKKY